MGFIQDSLRLARCEVLYLSDASKAPFMISYETPMTGRMGAVCYAAPLRSSRASKTTGSTHEFEVRSGPSDEAQPEFWRDPSGVFTTVVVGIDVTRGLFVGVDPGMQDPSRPAENDPRVGDGNREHPLPRMARMGA
jgi:hypothetical protein